MSIFNQGDSEMNKKISWIPSLLIISGGLYTIFYLNHLLNELQQFEEETSGFGLGFLHAIAEVTLAFSYLMIFPLAIAGIITVIGIITIWKQYVGLAAITLIMALILMNWIGCILVIIGSISGLVTWGKQPVKQS